MSEQRMDSEIGDADVPSTGVEGDADVPATGADDAAADRLAAGADAPEVDVDTVDGSDVDGSGPSHALTEPVDDEVVTDQGEPVGRADAVADREQATPADGDEE